MAAPVFSTIMASVTFLTSANPGSKTPISYLQEECTKRGLFLQYDLMANEGPSHDPTFIYKVKAGDVISTGKGTTKKKAKHNAALSVLQMMGITYGESEIEEGYNSGTPANTGTNSAPQTTDQKDAESMVGNPVGKLQELTQKHGWPPPVYKFIPEQEHVMEFICQVRLGKQAKKGVGKSKTSAKRDAANAMLLALNEGTAIHQVAAEKYPGQSHEENVPIMRDGGKRVPAFTPQASHKGKMAQDENSAPLEVGEIFEILKGIAPLLLILISTCFLYMCMKRETTQNKAKHPAEMEQVYSPKNNEERDQDLEKTLGDVINNIRGYLIEYLDTIDPRMIAILVEKQVINNNAGDKIKGKTNQDEKVDLLLDHISNSPRDRFKGFCKVLGEFKQTNIIEHVNDAIRNVPCSDIIKVHLKQYIISTA